MSIKEIIDYLLRVFSIVFTLPGFLILSLIIFKKQINNLLLVLLELIKKITKVKVGNGFEFCVADKYVPTNDIDQGLEEIECNKSYEKELTAYYKEVILFIRARINYTHEAGAQYLMRIKVNDEILKANHLINKPIDREIIGGLKKPWFDNSNDSWFINYSPNYRDNYFHPIYKVENGDPYIFIFDLRSIKKNPEEKYKISIEHNGMKGNEAYRNSIIIQKPEIY